MNLENPVKPIEILLVEDSPSDALLTKRALAETLLRNRLHLVQDGVSALAFLHKLPPYSLVPRPDLILLDLNLPKKDGYEVLKEIKSDDYLKVIPVIILTTSTAQNDIQRTYQLHANCYISKPVDFQSFVTAISILETFWLSIAKLPSTVGF